MECSRRIYTRGQWNNFYRECNLEKKRKLSKNCKSESLEFSGNGSSGHACCVKGVNGNGESSGGSTSRRVGKIVGEKAKVSGNSGNDDNLSFMKELNKNKRRKRNAGTEKNNSGDYTEPLIESSGRRLRSAGKVVDKNMKGKGKGKIVSGAGNVHSNDEDRDETCGSLLNEKSSYFDDDYSEYLNGLKKNKKKRGDYTEPSFDPHLDSTGKVVKEVDKNSMGKGKGKIVSDAGNVSSKDETFTVGEEEFALQSILSEKTDNLVEKSSKNENEKALAADNLNIDNGEVYYHDCKELGDESCGGPLYEKNSYLDDEYTEFFEEYLAFLAYRREKSENWVERNNGEEEEDKKRGSDTGNASDKNNNDDCIESLDESFAVSSDSTEMLEKWAEEKKKKKVKRREKLEVTDDNVSPKVEGENDDYIKGGDHHEGPAYHLRSCSVSRCEMKEKKLKNVRNPLPASEEDCGSEPSSDEEKKKKKGKRREKLEVTDDNVSPKVEGENDDYIKGGDHHEGPAYHLRSCSVSRCEMKEKKLKNVTNPLPASEEDCGSEPSSDEDTKNDNCMQNHVHKDKKKVEHPSKRRKSKHGVGDLNFKKILLNSISENVDVTKSNLKFCKENIPEQLPLKFRFKDEDPAPPEKNEWEEEIEGLFVDLQTGLQELKDSLTTQPLVDKDIKSAEKCDDSAVCCQKGKHFLILDEQIGLMCKYCSFVYLERKYILPSFANKTRRRQSMRFSDELHCLLTDDNLPLDGTAGNHCTSIHGGTTVWDILPRRTRETMYPHQREGFEFLWRNIAGDIHIENLKKLQSDSGKGCIISHAPGTGKTRLTIVFLQSFMKLFPASHPVIIAPRSMLLTWEEEFQKWGVDIPFYNLNNTTLSGRENSVAHVFQNEPRSTESKRMLKVYSWAKGSGILGLTYSLFAQLVRVKEDKEHDMLRKILLQVPGLVVLDEGHTPRNDGSLIWKALSKLETPRRVILSGTPFQNNFDELYNTLCLVCPKLSDFTSGSQVKYRRKRKAAKKRWDRLTSSIGKNKNDEIKELKRIIAPLVHVHNGSVLQERLPGLRSTLVYLKPTSLQQKLLGLIPQKNSFEEDHFMTYISVHPSLVKDLPDFSEYRSEVEHLELDPDAGAKTEFLFALINLSVSHGERVIVFSQFIAPMDLIKKQLKSVFDWVEGKEVLVMDGDIDIHHRQASINALNDPKSDAKVLLASTKACSEGINLIGASRVVLLDVVWNPSVKRQAISRAYRFGQKKIVHVYHLISSTMEARKYACQVKKDLISELVFSTSDGLPCKTGLPVYEDKILEAMVHHPKHGHIFDRLVYGPKESDLIDPFDFAE